MRRRQCRWPAGGVGVADSGQTTAGTGRRHRPVPAVGGSCRTKRIPTFFFGAREPIVQKNVEKFKAKYPQLDIAGYRNGYFTQEEEKDIADQIRDSRADILFVGMSSPKKEKFLNQWMPHMQVPFSMGVGGSFDIVAGLTKRAPKWMQESGLEWLHRFLQEPRRMWWRYAKTNTIFIWKLLKIGIKD